MTTYLGILGAPNPRGPHAGPHERGGGMLPSIRTTYTLHIREALHALAESNPSPHHYATERARILEAT